MKLDADPAPPMLAHPIIVAVHTPGTAVLSPRSSVVEVFHTIFATLEPSATNMLMTSISYCRHVQTAQKLMLRLPRYNLNFLVDARGQIQCEDMPGYFISSVQSVGTLFGLQNKLVLEDANNSVMRKVLIPDGTIEVIKGNAHAMVTISPPLDPGHNVRAFLYEIDNLIGRLIGDGTLTSWFTLVYLHILTSYWLSDPLIHCTGVQRALMMLRSANSFSFMELTIEHFSILEMIANTSPLRHYYPAHLTCMETVTWHPALSFLCQIAPFTRLVEDIFQHGIHQQLFFDGGPTLQLDQQGPLTLSQRAERRNIRFVSAEMFSPQMESIGQLSS